MIDCSTCDKNRTASVPYIVHESAEARHERTEKRLITALVLAVLLLFISNAIWLYSWMQYDYGTIEDSYSVDMDAGDGIATYVGEDGDISYGTNSSD